MLQYINALESFETDCNTLYGEYVMEAFAPVGAMEPIQQKAKSGWEYIRRIAGKIWEFVKMVAGRIKDAAGRLSAALRKAPNDADGDPEAAKKAEEGANRATNLINSMKNKLGSLTSLFNKLRNSNSADEMDAVASEAGQITGALSGKEQGGANESFTSFLLAMEADDAENVNTNAASKKKARINISGLKSKVQSAVSSCSGIIASANNLIGQINQSITGFMNRGGNTGENNEEGESDTGTQTRRQKALSALLRAVSWIVKKAEGIPAQLTALYGRVFKRNGTHIKEYDGELPEIG